MNYLKKSMLIILELILIYVWVTTNNVGIFRLLVCWIVFYLLVNILGYIFLSTLEDDIKRSPVDPIETYMAKFMHIINVCLFLYLVYVGHVISGCLLIFGVIMHILTGIRVMQIKKEA